MSTTVWKYPIQMGGVGDDFELRMQKDAVILHAGFDHETSKPALWARVDSEASTELRKISVRGTGHNADGLENVPFLGTVTYPHLALVFHFWAGWPVLRKVS